MADKKITQFTELTTPANDDLIVIVDVSDTSGGATGTTKKIQKSNLAPTIASPRTHIIQFTVPSSITTASATWQTLWIENSNIYVPTITASGYYNPTLDTFGGGGGARVGQWVLPFNCTIKSVKYLSMYNNTPLTVNVIYAFGSDSGNNFTNVKTIATKVIPTNSSGLRTLTEYSSGDMVTSHALARNGIITFAMFNNNISAGNVRNSQIIVELEETL